MTLNVKALKPLYEAATEVSDGLETHVAFLEASGHPNTARYFRKLVDKLDAAIRMAEEGS